MATVEVTAQRLWQFGTYLNGEVFNDFHKVARDQAGLQGCNKDGLTGLTSPLHGTMDWLHGQSDKLLDTAVDRVHGVSNGLISSAYSYAGMDTHSRDRFDDTPDNHRPRDTGGAPGPVFSDEGSPFHNPNPVVAKSIEVKQQTITESMEGKARGSKQAEAVNWIVRNFSEQLGLGGKDLRQLVIEPLTGNFNRIRANGEAWADVGGMLNTILTNFGDNAKKLVLSDWTGEAAQAFLEHVDVVWAGGLYVASKCAEWLQNGFDTLAELVEKIAVKCAQIFDRLVDKIVDLGMRFIPGLGQIIMAIEWIASGFQDFPAWSDIEEVARIVAEITQLHQTVKNLVDAAQKYIAGFEQALNAVESIPQIGSIDDAKAAAGEFRKGAEQMKQARTDFDKNAGSMQKQLDDMSAQAPK